MAGKVTGIAEKAKDTAQDTAASAAGTVAKVVPSAQLSESVRKLLETVANRAIDSLSGKLTETAGRLTDFAESGGGGGLLSAITGGDGGVKGKAALGALKGGLSGIGGKLKEKAQGVVGGLPGMGNGKGDRGDQIKVTNIFEQIDVGVPVDLAYDLWTQFTDFPTFMKKVENVEQVSDEKTVWKAQVFWSHRTWEGNIVEQVPGERIVWRSEADKGHVDGAVTFHEVTPDLTKIILVLEYYPKGFMERTGNLWRAQGRRARLELKHFARHVMSHVILHPDEIEGWRGEIRDGEVVDGRGEDESEEGESEESDEARESDEDRDSDEEESDEGESEEGEESAVPEPRRERAGASAGKGGSNR